LERELLNISVMEGAMAEAVLRSIWLEMPSGPEAVLILTVLNSLQTSSVVVVTSDRPEPLTAVGRELHTHELL